MRPTVEYIAARFAEYNTLFFEGKLPVPLFRSGNARTMLGHLKYRRRRGLLGRVTCSDFVLTVSSRFDLPEREVQDTIIHEMIHLYILSGGIRDTSSHGTVFRTWMQKINTEYGRHITISHRFTTEELSADNHCRKHYFCVCELTDGRMGITVSSESAVCSIHLQLPRAFALTSCRWYGSTDPYFNRFPHVRTPKIYIVDREELEPYLRSSVELVFDGRSIRPV